MFLDPLFIIIEANTEFCQLVNLIQFYSIIIYLLQIFKMYTKKLLKQKFIYKYKKLTKKK